MQPAPVALIAGMGEGLGEAIAIAFAKSGYDIYAMSRTVRIADKVRPEIERTGRAFSHTQCDLSDPDDAAAAASSAAARTSVLIYCAHLLHIAPFAIVAALLVLPLGERKTEAKPA